MVGKTPTTGKLTLEFTHHICLQMNIFSRLLKLYRTNSFKTPLEDFTTEILVGILSQSGHLLDTFVNEVLKIEGRDFVISSQEHFRSDVLTSDCRVDIVIRNEDTLCFLENKVECSEGNEQLLRYSKILSRFSPLATHLRYCTKYYDHKEIVDHQFHQFRWLDISNFLKRQPSTEITQEFLSFLKDKKMDNSTTFTAVDLIALENINAVVNRMEVYLEKIKPEFRKQFGNTKDISNLNQIKEKERFILLKDRIFGEGYNEVGVGFDFKDTVRLVVWLWCGAQNSKAEEFKKILKKPVPEGFITNNNDWIALRKPLSDFLSNDGMESEIESWFHTSFASFKSFADSTPNLEWKII